MNMLHFVMAASLPLLGSTDKPTDDNHFNKSSLSITQTTTSNITETIQITDHYTLENHSDDYELTLGKYLLDVPLIKQNPELKYGCEVTSLAMMLQYAGVNTSKMELYSNIKKDDDPIHRSSSGDILRWGNPAEGFVGDMTGKHAGYAVYDKPMEELVNRYLPNRAVNLTNHRFEEVLQHVAHGYPVVVWTTGDYRLPDRPESWLHNNQTITTPLDLHAVVLVGYDDNNVYINDPLSGKKQYPVNKQQFIESWKALQSRAISFK